MRRDQGDRPDKKFVNIGVIREALNFLIVGLEKNKY